MDTPVITNPYYRAALSELLNRATLKEVSQETIRSALWFYLSSQTKNPRLPWTCRHSEPRLLISCGLSTGANESFIQSHPFGSCGVRKVLRFEWVNSWALSALIESSKLGVEIPICIVRKIRLGICLVRLLYSDLAGRSSHTLTPSRFSVRPLNWILKSNPGN